MKLQNPPASVLSTSPCPVANNFETPLVTYMGLQLHVPVMISEWS